VLVELCLEAPENARLLSVRPGMSASVMLTDIS
jgi:hypothetical protein